LPTDCFSAPMRCCMSGDWDLAIAGISSNATLHAATAKWGLEVVMDYASFLIVTICSRFKCQSDQAERSVSLKIEGHPKHDAAGRNIHRVDHRATLYVIQVQVTISQLQNRVRFDLISE